VFDERIVHGIERGSVDVAGEFDIVEFGAQCATETGHMHRRMLTRR